MRRRASSKDIQYDDGPIYLTAEGFAHLKEKLAHLKHALPGFIDETAQAAAYGDRSENAEYKDAKMTLRRTHRQIWSIEDQIKRVVVIPQGVNTSGVVKLGSTVVLEADGARFTFQILGSHETDPALGRISNESPLGSALINRRAGDDVTIKTAGGAKTYRILEVK